MSSTILSSSLELAHITVTFQLGKVSNKMIIWTALLALYSREKYDVSGINKIYTNYVPNLNYFNLGLRNGPSCPFNSKSESIPAGVDYSYH